MTKTSPAVRALRASVASLACTLVLAGCAAGIKGRADPPEYLAKEPTNSVYVSRLQNAIKTAAAAEASYCALRETSCPPDSELEVKIADLPGRDANEIEKALVRFRNDYLYSMMEAYDLALQDYARSLSVEGRSVSFGSHLVSLGLAAANTISPGETLSALTTAALGVEKGYDAEVLIGKTVPALINQMRAAQSEKRTAIAVRLQQTTAAYPLTAAKLDIAQLGSASTIETAITAISEQAEDAKNTNQKQEEFTRTTIACENDANVRIKAWLSADEALFDDRFDRAEEFLTDNGRDDLNVTAFIFDCQEKDLQAAFIDDVIEDGS